MRVRYSILAVAALGLGAVVLAAAAGTTGPTLSAEVTDPAGDMKNNAEPWLDVIRGGIVRQGGTFTFSMEMAAPLPADPPEAPGGLGWYFWNWGIDTDPDLAPAGWPFPKTHAAAHDFIVGFASDGEDYFAFVADRRPLVLGQDVVITPVPWTVDGASIRVFVDADLLDDPAGFLWRCGPVIAHAHLESDGLQVIDLDNSNWVPWPQN